METDLGMKAAAVVDAVVALNAAIRDAANAGLDVVVSQREEPPFPHGVERARPVVSVTVGKHLASGSE